MIFSTLCSVLPLITYEAHVTLGAVVIHTHYTFYHEMADTRMSLFGGCFQLFHSKNS